jgi:PAS domain S-box-containing protein
MFRLTRAYDSHPCGPMPSTTYQVGIQARWRHRFHMYIIALRQRPTMMWEEMEMPKGHGDVTKAELLTEEEREQSVVITNPALADNPMIFVSDEFEVQTGYAPEEALGRNCRFLQGPDTDREAVQAIREAIETESPITVDILNYKKDGTKFWNRLRIRPLYDEDGKVMFYAGAQNPIDAAEVRSSPSDSIET